jgi:hypothetical protein
VSKIHVIYCDISETIYEQFSRAYHNEYLQIYWSLEDLIDHQLQYTLDEQLLSEDLINEQ